MKTKNLKDLKSDSYFSQISEYKKHFGDVLTLEQVAYLVGLNPFIVKRLVSYELIEIIDASSEPLIQVEKIPEIKKIARLHYDLGVGWNSMGIVLDLLKKIEELEEKVPH